MSTTQQPVPQSAPRIFVPPGREQLLADLRWLLLSPPLLCAETYPGLIHRFTAPEQAAVESWLSYLERHSGPDAAQLDVPRPLRLGRYAEHLLRFFLGPVRKNRSEPQGREHGFDLLAHSLARRGTGDEASTLGEIDFLLQTPDGQSWHWELAVKVYLCKEQAGREQIATATSLDLHGPNRVETFETKLDKLFGKQLQQPIPCLPYDSEAPEGLTRLWHRAALTKGRIFYRLGESSPVVFTAQGKPLLNPEHLRGFWCPAREFDALLQAYPGSAAWPLERLEWLSPKTASTFDFQRERMDAEKASALASPVMITLMRDDVELTRGFVLPDRLVVPDGTPS